MNKKQVYKQLSLKNKAFKTSFESGLSINAVAESWRNRIKQVFTEAKLKPEELALANAIFLGERQYLSKETLQNFQASGTIHILAISGLHIGILLIFLNFIFAFVKRYIGVLPFIITTLSLLWLYAMMTGFSPSVTRAVTMFSFLQIGLQLKRSTNIYNTIFASALLMMLVNPNVIYQVGFQMSYAAVLSIVSFFPIIIKYFTVRHKIAQWFIDLLVVSASAQLGVLPFSLYYFHQFPVYFFLANLLVIPLLFLLLFYGFSYILIALTGFIIPKSDWLFEQILSIILGINKHIAGFESALLTQIRFSLPQLVISIALIIIFYHLLKKEQKIKYAYLFLLIIMVFQAEILFEKHRKSKQNEYYIFQQYKTSVVGENSGENFVFYQTKDHINPYLLKDVSLQFNHISFDTISFVRKIHQKTILHIDSLGIFQYQNLKADIIHLQYSPKINLDRAISILKPKIIVADGSNYVSYIKRWQNSAKNANVLFYNTNNEGAFILK
jgi:competence protein ComEC